LQAKNGFGFSIPVHKGRTISAASWLLT